jgi:hypothetical protein
MLVSITILGLIGSLFRTNVSNGTSVGVNIGTGTNTENDNKNDADIDTDSDKNEISKNTITFTDYNFENLLYSANVDQSDNLSVEVVKYGDNDVLSVSKDMNCSPSQYVWFVSDEEMQSSGTYVFEADFAWSGSENGLVDVDNQKTWFAKFAISDGTGYNNSDIVNVYVMYESFGAPEYGFSTNFKSLDESFITLYVGEWYHLKLEYNVDDGVLYFYINDTCLLIECDLTNIAEPVFEIENRGKVIDSTFLLDNVSCYSK